MTATVRNWPALSGNARHLLAPIVASWLILLASLTNFLRYNDYPLLRPEVGTIALLMLALAVAVGLVHRAQRPLGQALLDALLVFFVVDQNVGPFAYAAAAAAVAGAITFYRGRSILPLLGVAAAAALVSGLAGIDDAHARREHRPEPPASTSDAARPALVHIVLDEHLGVEGFPEANPKARAVRRQLKAFYTTHGFRLFGRAYSEQFRTVNAIPQILNFGDVLPLGRAGMGGRSLDRNAYFDLLAKRGYRLTVYQSDYIDYCGNPAVARCERYTFSKMGAAANASMSLGDRVSVIMVRFALLADVAQNVRALYMPLFRDLKARGYHPPGVSLMAMGRTSSLNAAEAFDTLISDLRRARPGDAYFAHILLPHDPYALAPDCAPKPLRQWRLHDPGSPIAERRAAYFDQVQCVLRKIAAAYAALSDSPAGERFVMIVHGDHGSRITEVNPTVETLGKFDRDDLVAGYSTLFAIHAPGIPAGYDPQTIAVPGLLKGLAASRFADVPPAEDRRQIILNDRRWAPKRRVSFHPSW